MNIVTHDLFAQHFQPLSHRGSVAITPADAGLVQVQTSRDLDADVEKMKSEGFVPVGTAEFVARGSLGLGREAGTEAVRVGATAVVFRLVPAKLGAIRKTQDGAIDLKAVLADPSASLSPRGYYVVQSVFLAKEGR
jgi:hypothetical protein